MSPATPRRHLSFFFFSFARPCIASKDEYIAENAIALVAMYDLTDAAVESALTRLVKAPSGEVANASAALLSTRLRASIQKSLSGYLEHRDAAVRVRAVWCLSFGDDAFASQLRRLRRRADVSTSKLLAELTSSRDWVRACQQAERRK